MRLPRDDARRPFDAAASDVVARAHLRARMVLVPLLGLCAALVILVLATLRTTGAATPPGLDLIGVASVLMVLLCGLTHSLRHTRWWTGGVFACATLWIVVVLLILDRAPTGWPISAEASMGFALVWAAVLLSVRFVAALTAVLVATAMALGIGWSLAPTLAPTPSLGVFHLGSAVLAALLVSWRICALDREVRGPVLAMVRDLERRGQVLEGSLSRKIREVELSVDRLVEVQKLEGLRTIAGRLAHELNNTLTPLRGMAELLARSEDEAVRARCVEQILQSSVDAAGLAESLLTYTRQGLFAPVRTDLGRFISDEVLGTAAADLPDNISLASECSQQVTADVDRDLLRQSMLQILSNAADAMPRGGNISVRLSAGPARADGRRCARIVVVDEGEGIDAAALARVREPFFTTKGPRATGLGLAIVDGVVAHHGGHLYVDSGPDGGTTVTIELPLARAPRMQTSGAMAPGGAPRVLMVAEDQDVLDVLEDVLLSVACCPVPAPTLARALDLLDDSPRPHLLLLDRAFRHAQGILEATRARGVPCVVAGAGAGAPVWAGAHSAIHLAPLDPAVLAQLVTEAVHGPLAADASGSALAPVAAGEPKPSQTSEPAEAGGHPAPERE